ncbi:MAG: DUF1330 domain-containing protein [Ornithinibacter sp.]
MTAYVVLTQKVSDVNRYVGEYAPQAMPILQKYGIEVLVFQVGTTAVEGDADSVVILRADSEEALRGFYDDPDYAGPKALRHSITSGADMLIAPAFEPSA